MSKPHNRIQGLDALRGLAILLVMLRHSWGDTFGGAGIVGVVAFFTLSGYLITGLLASDVRTYGRVRYLRFYKNRAIRLLPALVFALAGFAVVEGLLDLGGHPAQVLRTVEVALTYTANVPGLNHGSDDMSHLWTLANEEQFYLVWPILILLAVRFRKEWLTVTIAAAAIVAVLGATILFTEPLVKIYTWPSTWTIAMVVGAACQLGRNRLSLVLRGVVARIGGVVGLVGLVGLSFLPDAKSNPFVYLFGGAVIAVLTMLVVWWWKDIAVMPAWSRPLVWLGTISYAAYLWNYPIGWWLRDLGVTDWQAPAILLTVAAAAVSWFAVERPFNRLKNLRTSPADQADVARPKLRPRAGSASHHRGTPAIEPDTKR
ncbi:hypothetical protein ASE16_18675 [Leifsonia sp. Root227]|uniref:acyltransferase family protein n=1 Tax=Leifsonia sp. Root227 TaxID=1736496 RepID=UPI0006F79E05|nr:acyltransferase [Leifsonia sp. Root227]KRC47330.1 hypothetical protein ASE16_18675 [Leifsonia sp. Root227]